MAHLGAASCLIPAWRLAAGEQAYHAVSHGIGLGGRGKPVGPAGGSWRPGARCGARMGPQGAVRPRGCGRRTPQRCGVACMCMRGAMINAPARERTRAGGKPPVLYPATRGTGGSGRRPPHADAQARGRVVGARKRGEALGALEGALVRVETSLGEASGSARAHVEGSCTHCRLVPWHRGCWRSLAALAVRS